MGDDPTAIGQRSGEVFVEICIFVIVVLIEILVMKKLLRRIKILEGFFSGIRQLQNDPRRKFLEENGSIYYRAFSC